MKTLWLIWNHERQMWWKPAEYGYTPIRADAGRYTIGDAMAIVNKANLTAEETPEETMVPDWVKE